MENKTYLISVHSWSYPCETTSPMEVVCANCPKLVDEYMKIKYPLDRNKQREGVKREIPMITLTDHIVEESKITKEKKERRAKKRKLEQELSDHIDRRNRLHEEWKKSQEELEEFQSKYSDITSSNVL